MGLGVRCKQWTRLGVRYEQWMGLRVRYEQWMGLRVRREQWMGLREQIRWARHKQGGSEKSTGRNQRGLRALDKNEPSWDCSMGLGALGKRGLLSGTDTFWGLVVVLRV